jgi:hypothetical protein
VFDAVYGIRKSSGGPTLKMRVQVTERKVIMKTKVLILSGAALIALNVSSVFAQQSNTSTPDPSIAQRKDNQQDRIANGVQSGQLTAGETKNLETKEAGINKEESTMRSEDSGHLTSADRTTLNRQQNHLSNQIYNDKHNANTAHYGNNEVGQRRENQQDRIAQGIKSGQLTAGETAKLERQQQSINHEDASMRAANGGKLTGADKAALNHRQNNASKNIYAKKHNAQTQK